MPQLPVLETIAAAYRFIWDNRKDFVHVATVPVVVLTLLYMISAFVSLAALGTNTAAGSNAPMTLGAGWTVMFLIGFVGQTAITLMFAVAWHRRFLAPGQAGTVWSAIKWDARKTDYLVKLMLIGLICIAVFFGTALPGLVFFGFGVAGMLSAAPILVMAPLAFLVFIPAYYVFSRFSLSLPAATVGDPVGLTESWGRTKGNGFRLLFVNFLSQLPVIGAALVIALVIGQISASMSFDAPLTGTLIWQIFSIAVSILAMAVGISALSISYQHFRDNAPSAPLATE